MQAPLSHADFTVLVRRAGLPLSPTELDELYEAWGSVELMLGRVRRGVRPREAEPALVFGPQASA